MTSERAAPVAGDEGAGVAGGAAIDRSGAPRWYSMSVDEALERLDGDAQSGLDPAEAERRIAEYGRNELPAEPAPSRWSLARVQISNPMNIMLAVVAVASMLIGQLSTGIVVAVLVCVNVAMGTNQEIKARASVDALAELQVPSARVRRGGRIEEIDATDLVPGDIVLLEAGDLVPADGRIVSSATFELQEAALTGESAPIAKDSQPVDGDAEGDDVALGDRTDLVFQNTQVTRGTATVLVTGTGVTTEMGRIAGMVRSVEHSKSPLQRELDGLTKVFGAAAWLAVAVIAAFGIARGQDRETLVLLCVATAISAIPTGLPTFVQTMLSSGSSRLAEEKAVVKTLTDVETLGGTTSINSDKTGTLTMNAMTATKLFSGGQWFTIEGSGYRTQGAILSPAGQEQPDFSRLGLGLTLCSDATVAPDETIIGDPTEAALVVLAAKIGIDAEETRRALPRRAEVPFDSEYKFMATFHDRQPWMTTTLFTEPSFASVKGAPDVVLSRCDRALWHGDLVPIDDVRDEIIAANRELSEKGLRVLSFAGREMSAADMSSADNDPMPFVDDLVMIALVGIIDPLRTEAKEAVRVALAAGIDVRMITGDHTVTARAIADDLGLGPGVMRGVDFARLPDDEVIERLPELHVFGRVAPEDKVRLAALMQRSGEIVAMTGDAVNDAAALKQADIGVAMGSGSEVSKQAAKMILTDDNFATLVKAVEFGRDIYRRISSYIRVQLTVLSAVLQLMLLATILDINEGIALFPLMLLFCKFFVVSTIVVGFVIDVPDPGVMQRPPREPGSRIVNRSSSIRFIGIGLIIAAGALALLAWGPGEPSTTGPSTSMTMAFALVALSAVNLGLAMRREREPAWSTPLFPYLGWIMAGWTLTVAAVELRVLQRVLDTTSLTGAQWGLVVLLSLIAPLIVEVDKAVKRHRLPAPALG
jgi:P-type Ca2+ transporter type 2C